MTIGAKTIAGYNLVRQAIAGLSPVDRLTVLIAATASEIVARPVAERQRVAGYVAQEMPDLVRACEAGMRAEIVSNARRGI